MNYKTLAQLSIFFVALIFLSQALLVFNLFQRNKELLTRELTLVSQEAYNMDMNLRLKSIGGKEFPNVKVIKEPVKIRPEDEIINIDEMNGFDKSNAMTLVNIGMEMYLSKERPIVLRNIDSITSALLAKNGIFASVYSRMVDTEKNVIFASSNMDHKSSTFLIKSRDIPLNFLQTKVLQIVLLNPMLDILSQMIGILLLSFLMSLFCIYCLYLLQRTLFKQKILTQSKNDFYNHVSHELKRPISVLYHAIDSLLNTKAIEDPIKRKKYLGLSINELTQMNVKIDMIMTMSMDEEGMFNLNSSRFDLPDMILEIKNNTIELAAKPVTIIIVNQLSQNHITADRDHFYQCICNLIENAIKYSGAHVNIVIDLSVKVGSLFVSVKDDGHGINIADVSKIFEKFTRVSDDRKIHGYGIGLSYIKQIVEKHHGHISVKSEIGKGSEFIIQIPQN